uniref:Uncharacterized protein n=1 Tax=Avena sativa TaxID=4498 RepID=A0ACD5VLL5_AVESA
MNKINAKFVGHPLKKKVLSNEIDEDHIDMLKDIGFKIVQKCGGLPLAVKVMGGLPHKRGELRREWQQVLDDAKWSINEMPQELNNAVYLSYEDMPCYLKQCFLYYSLLPKSREFIMDQVVGMWISEGFVHGNSSDLEELGTNYYKELISRNLIEQDESLPSLWVCHMHDVVRSFAQYTTKDESLVAHSIDNDILTKLSSQKFLRLSIVTGQSQSGELDWKYLHEQQSVRTLISNIQIKTKLGDSLVTFSSLRTLHMESADVAVLVESLHQLKHLRYLALVNSDISTLPVSIGKMKLLQYLDLSGCKNLLNLPVSIVKLAQLRLLFLDNVSMIPRGFCSLTNMRKLSGFQTHTDDNWCSLDELGPLSNLKFLELCNLENVSAASFAANARLGEKKHLIKLSMQCTSRLGHDGLVQENEGFSEEEQRRIEKVFDELYPPHSVEDINMHGYFGQQLPSWMMSTSTVPLNNLKFLYLSDLAYCTQLPTGLCQLPCLHFLLVCGAPSIRRVGTGFLQAAATPFPMLKKMELIGMVEWEEWEWEEKVKVMPRLEELILRDCKLMRAPPGLASNARALKKLILEEVQNLSYLENFPCIVDLLVYESPNLERITDLPSLQKLSIINCSKLKVLDSIPALDRLFLKDYAMEQLPEYMRHIKSRHLQLHCRVWLLAKLAAGQSGTEWDKFSHVEHINAYAPDGSDRGKWYMVYTKRDNLKLDSNISSSTVFQETLSSSMVGAQGFEYMYKIRRSTFSYICSLVMTPFLEDMMVRDHTFLDGRVLSLQDRVAIALRVLNSGEPPEIVGSSIGVDESTTSLLTQVFVEAMCTDERLYACWPRSTTSKMEKIKHKFNKIHGLPNCCGVVHIADINFGSQNTENEENGSTLLQVVIGPDMRFTTLCLGPSGSMNLSSILHFSFLFKESEKGTWLNGTKLNLSDGSDVGEYIIGDSGYPLRPWLLTPYQLEGDLSDSDYKKEFNKRHSEATAVVVQRALAGLKDTWKCLQGEGWHPRNQRDMVLTVGTCCLLHNIVMDMEEEGPGIPSDQEQNKMEHVRQIADEDAVKVRDALSQHLMESGVHTTVGKGGSSSWCRR